GSIHYEQSGSLTIGSVGGIAGLAAGDTVEVAARDDQLAVEAGVDADGDVTLAGDGVVVDAQGSVTGTSVALQAGSSGMALNGQVAATTTVTLESMGAVNQGENAAIRAESLELLGTGSYDL